MLRLIPLLPVFVILVYAVAMVSRLEAYHSSHASLLGFIYLYNFLRLRRQGGLGFRMFRFSLVVLSAAFFEHAFIFLWMYNRGNAPDWARYLHHETYYDFALHCVMAFSAMAMWSETQMDRLRGLLAEVETLRRENSNRSDLDSLTGLLTRRRWRGAWNSRTPWTAWWWCATWIISRRSTTATDTWWRRDPAQRGQPAGTIHPP